MRKSTADECWRIVKMLNELRDEEGTTITFCNDNPDFNGQPDCLVMITAPWTQWDESRFTGDTILNCLQKASKFRAERTD